jgi:hypothetical protein
MASSAYQHLASDVSCFVNALHPLVRPLGVANPDASLDAFRRRVPIVPSADDDPKKYNPS